MQSGSTNHLQYMDKFALAGVGRLLAEDYLHRLEGIPEVIAYRKDGTKTAFAVIAKNDGLEAQQQKVCNRAPKP